jgi:hypothetical protein
METELRRKMNMLQQEVIVGTWDNVILALTLFIIGIGITLILTGFSKLFPLSPNWLLITLISLMTILFILQIFSLFLDSIFSKKNRFTNKSKFISFILSFFIFLILVVGLPYLLSLILKPNIYTLSFKTGSFGFYLLAILIYGIPILFWIKTYQKIKEFFKRNCPTLILRGVLSLKGQDREKLLKHWNTTLLELRKIDREY